MSKDTFYFSHDYNTRSNPKIKRILKDFGAEGYGIYWMIVEDLYNNANALPTDYESIAYDLRTNENIVSCIINDYDLFIVNDDYFGSTSIEKRLDKRAEKSKKARESANKRWNKNANALQTQSEPNAIKESKVKDIKGKESKIKLIPKQEDRINYNEIKDVFNSLCLGLPSIKLITDKRKKLINARQKDFSLETIGDVFRLASKSDFLNGGSANGFTASFDWLLNASNFIKVLEGNYNNKPTNNNQNQPKETATSKLIKELIKEQNQ